MHAHISLKLKNNFQLNIPGSGCNLDHDDIVGQSLTVYWEQRGGACGLVGRHLDRRRVQIRRVVGGA